MKPVIFIWILLSVSLNAMAQICLRKGMLAVGQVNFARPFSLAVSVGTSFWVWAGMACYAVSILLWLGVLSKVQVSVAYPFLSIGYIIAAAVGFAYLGESVGWARMAGIGFICVGLFFINKSA
jgi:drug/metabolite transporter (DMT)-like permease